MEIKARYYKLNYFTYLLPTIRAERGANFIGLSFAFLRFVYSIDLVF
jgi:hypothetical protein